MNIVMKEDLITEGYEALTPTEAISRLTIWRNRTQNEDLRFRLDAAINTLILNGDSFIGREVFYSSKYPHYPCYLPITRSYTRYDAEIINDCCVKAFEVYCDRDTDTYWASSDEVYRYGFVYDTDNLSELYEDYANYEFV